MAEKQTREPCEVIGRESFQFPIKNEFSLQERFLEKATRENHLLLAINT